MQRINNPNGLMSDKSYSDSRKKFSIFNNSKKNQDKIDEERIKELEEKGCAQRTNAEDKELELLKCGVFNDMPYATRAHVIELNLLEDKRTPWQERELHLLMIPLARPFTYRILDLEAKPNRTPWEEKELQSYYSPYTLPHMQYFPRSAFPEKQTESQRRSDFIFNNEHSLPFIETILNFEQMQMLTPKEKAMLTRCYLAKVAKVPPVFSIDLNADYSSVFYNTSKDCVIIDTQAPLLSRGAASLHMVERQFQQAARTLIDSYMKQFIRIDLSKASDETRERIEGLKSTRIPSLKLVLAKIFFDDETDIKELDNLVAKLKALVENKLILFATDDHLQLEKYLKDKILDITLGNVLADATQEEKAYYKNYLQHVDEGKIWKVHPTQMEQIATIIRNKQYSLNIEKLYMRDGKALRAGQFQNLADVLDMKRVAKNAPLDANDYISVLRSFIERLPEFGYSPKTQVQTSVEPQVELQRPRP